LEMAVMLCITQTLAHINDSIAISVMQRVGCER